MTSIFRSSVLFTVFAAVLISDVGQVHAQAPPDLTREEDRMSSLSIVGYDPTTGEVGVFMASRAFAWGHYATRARGGIGAFAQMGGSPYHEGPALLRKLEEGSTPLELITWLRSQYDDIGQLNVVTVGGESLSNTGPSSSQWKGHRFGPNYATGGNILAGPAVVAGMGDVFEATEDSGLPLAERLMLAMEAAEAAGGDARGRQGAILRVHRVGAGPGGSEIVVNLNVDDSAHSIQDMRRLWEEWKLTSTYGVGYRPLEQSRGDDVRQLQHYLQVLGYLEAGDHRVFDEEGRPRGVFNDATSAAAVRWKEEHGLDDGRYLVQYMLEDLRRAVEGEAAGEGDPR